jgi:hypothetical protein
LKDSVCTSISVGREKMSGIREYNFWAKIDAIKLLLSTAMHLRASR